MRQIDIKTVSRVLSIALAACTLLLALLLIVQCVSIYCAGISPANHSDTGVLINDIYSPEIVAAGFSQIRWAFYLWLAAFIGSLLCLALGPAERKNAVAPPIENRLLLFRSRTSPTPEMQAETRRRRVAAAVCGTVCALCALMVAIYVCNLQNFSSRELESVLGRMLLHITPWICLAFIALTVLSEYRYKSMLRELESAKSAPRCDSKAQPKKTRALVPALRAAIILAAVLLLVAGVYNGGMRDVLVKAVNICTECIGLG